MVRDCCRDATFTSSLDQHANLVKIREQRDSALSIFHAETPKYGVLVPWRGKLTHSLVRREDRAHCAGNRHVKWEVWGSHDAGTNTEANVRRRRGSSVDLSEAFHKYRQT